MDFALYAKIPVTIIPYGPDIDLVKIRPLLNKIVGSQ